MAQFAAEMVWGGEVINHLTRARRELNVTLQSFDVVLEHHTELEMQLADLDAISAQEERAFEVKGLMAEKEALAADKEALTAEKRAVEAELEALTIKKTTVEVELDDNRARAEAEIKCLKAKAENAWGLGKEEFLKSSEFDNLCMKKSLACFECGFKSYVALLRPIFVFRCAPGKWDPDPPPYANTRLGDWVVTEAVNIKTSSGTFLKRKKGRLEKSAFGTEIP
ncbi:hypothetical protein F511_30351 [Dorcoceras hygrometricum]|uniref:Uncharacterized protein n=1 Tax=Dorcoceras hygrometricum TaxID=472368 RepID=A0A2Z7BA29_9LAMI|nr:hypothetical protein F511_30351 [Dorcoceras hygrometricum]